MKLIVAGSRSITSLDVVVDAIERVQGVLNAESSYISEIVSGGAKGVDSLGEEAARILGVGVRRFPARWYNESGKFDYSAGFKRNVEMGEYADVLLAVWDGQSRGTLHMMEWMKAREKRVFTFRPRNFDVELNHATIQNMLS
jgi:hypothetical protein